MIMVQIVKEISVLLSGAPQKIPSSGRPTFLLNKITKTASIVIKLAAAQHQLLQTLLFWFRTVYQERVKTWHLHTVASTATGVFCNIFPLLSRYSALTQSNKLTLYQLLIGSILTYAAPVWSSTCSSSYLRLQGIQSKCLRVISNHPRRTPISHLHYTLNIEPIHVIIHRLTAKCFAHCPPHTQSRSPTNRELSSGHP